MDAISINQDNGQRHLFILPSENQRTYLMIAVRGRDTWMGGGCRMDGAVSSRVTRKMVDVIASFEMS